MLELAHPECGVRGEGTNDRCIDGDTVDVLSGSGSVRFPLSLLCRECVCKPGVVFGAPRESRLLASLGTGEDDDPPPHPNMELRFCTFFRPSLPVFRVSVSHLATILCTSPCTRDPGHVTRT